jgi:uncharacterized protein YjlB
MYKMIAICGWGITICGFPGRFQGTTFAYHIKMVNMNLPFRYYCMDDGTFPNSRFPVLLYKGALNLPLFFRSTYLKNEFCKNNWSNAWDCGIFTYNHYHSNTHEVVGVYQGRTTLLLGGENGHRVIIEKGDLLIIPAGVAHRNLGTENQVKCVGAYPGGRRYDIKYGKPAERPAADKNIAAVPVPASDPLAGVSGKLPKIWAQSFVSKPEPETLDEEELFQYSQKFLN